MTSVEIICSACGADTIVRREPIYEGFRKVGESFVCSSCGETWATEEDVPFKEKKKSTLFSEKDLLPGVDVFEDDEKARNCRHCKHYLVNPFTQRCGLHLKEVQATDLCDDFDPAE